jgi:hypothetical protein
MQSAPRFVAPASPFVSAVTFGASWFWAPAKDCDHTKTAKAKSIDFIMSEACLMANVRRHQPRATDF